MTFQPHSEVYVIPGDSIESSPEWVSATRRCFPLLPDEDIIGAFDLIAQVNATRQRALDAQVDAEWKASRPLKVVPGEGDWPGYEC